VLDADPARGRERARDFVNDYLGLPNYVRNLRRLGFTDDDLRGPASDRLVDALVARCLATAGASAGKRLTAVPRVMSYAIRAGPSSARGG
jgi:hypothetical protein